MAPQVKAKVLKALTRVDIRHFVGVTRSEVARAVKGYEFAIGIERWAHPKSDTKGTLRRNVFPGNFASLAILDEHIRSAVHIATNQSFLGVDFTLTGATLAEFAAEHHRLSTEPASPYRRVCLIGRRDATGVDKLHALTLTRTGDVERRTVLEPPGDWWTALGDEFGIPAAAFRAAKRDLLWRKAAS